MHESDSQIELPEDESGGRRRDPFPETQWSVVRQARTEHDGRARQALDVLYRAYWPALYAVARGRGLSEADAEDAVQELFATRVLAGSLLENADPELGPFRSLVTAALVRVLKDGWRRGTAQKRDVQKTVSLATKEGEALYRALAARGLSPEAQADRTWAEQVLSNAMARVRQAHGPEEVGLFEQEYWAKEGTPDWSGVARRLGILVESLKQKVLRVRKSFRAAVEAEVRETTESREAYEEELRWLFRIIACPV